MVLLIGSFTALPLDLFPTKRFLREHNVQSYRAPRWPMMAPPKRHSFELVKEFHVEYRKALGKWYKLQEISCSPDCKQETVHIVNGGRGKSSPLYSVASVLTDLDLTGIICRFLRICPKAKFPQNYIGLQISLYGHNPPCNKPTQMQSLNPTPEETCFEEEMLVLGHLDSKSKTALEIKFTGKSYQLKGKKAKKRNGWKRTIRDNAA